MVRKNHSHRSLSRVTRVALAVLLSLPGAGWAQEPAAIDANLDQLMKLDPAQLAATLKQMKEKAATDAAEAKKFRDQAASLTAEADTLQGQVDSLMKHVESLGKAFNLLQAPPPEKMAAAPAEKPMAEEAAAKPLTNFADHVMPIMQQHCARCHNEDKKKSGLSVATFAGIMEGGSSGPVIAAGDPDGSRLLRLITKAEEPVMPPSGDLPADAIAVIRQWIADGAPADKNAKPKTAKAETDMAADAPVYIAAEFADTPPMPEVSLAAAHPLPTRGVVARSVDVSPRAPLMAVGGDRQVLLYNLDTFELLGALPYPEGDIFTLSFSLNGEVLVAGGGQEGDMGLAAVYNVRTGERLGTYGQFYDTVLAADISPDHRMIALGGAGKTVRVYDVGTGEVLYKLDKHTDWIYAVKFTPDGEVLSTADRAGNLQLWQAANGRHVEQLRGHEGAIHALDYTADSLYLVSAGEDGTVQVWDTWKFNRVRTFKAHGAPVLNLDVSSNGQIVTASSDKSSKIFNLEGKEQKKFTGMPDWAYQANFAREASLVLAGTWTGEILCYNVESGEVVKKLGTDPIPAQNQT